MAAETIGTARVDVVVDTSQFTTAVTAAKRSVSDMSTSAQQAYNVLDAKEKRRVDRLIHQANQIGFTKTQQLAYNAALRTQGPLLDEILRKIATQESAQRRLATASSDAAKRIGTAVGAAVAGATLALAALTRRAIDQADQLDEMSQKLQIGADQLSKWGYAARLSGTDLEGLSKGIGLFSRNLAAAMDADSKQGRLFAALGIEIKDAEGNLRSVESLLPEVADRFKVLDNQTTETALAMEIFGRSGADLLEFLNRGGDGIRALGDELSDLGGVIDNETAAAAADFKDELDRLQTTALGFGTDIAAQLLPALADTTREFRRIATDGDLARNAVSLISGAMQSGVWIIDQYNNAVARTSIAIETVARSAAGARETYANLFSFGLADGSVAGGLRAQRQAFADGQRDLDRLIEGQNAPRKVELIFAGEGAEPAGLFKMSESELALRTQYESLQERVNAMLTDRTGSGGAKGGRKAKALPDFAKEAQRELERMVEIEARARDAFLATAAALEGPVAEANYRYQQELAQLRENARLAGVGADELRVAEERLQAQHERNVLAIEAQLTPAQEVMAGLREEIALLGLSQVEQEKIIALRYAGADATAAQVDEIGRLVDAREQAARVAEHWDEVERSLADSLFDLARNAGDAKEIVVDFFDSIAEQITRMITEDWSEKITALFRGAGSGTGSGGEAGWANALWSLFGGGSAGWGWSRGGYTGDGLTHEPAGIVHRGEYVINAGAVKAMGRPALERINAGQQVPAGTGGVNVSQAFYVQGKMTKQTSSQAAREMGRELRHSMRLS